jgi:hypothetical protein
VGRLSRIETGHPFSMAGQHSPGRPDGFPSVAGLPRAGRGGLMAERTLASRARSLRAVVVRRGWVAGTRRSPRAQASSGVSNAESADSVRQSAILG